MSIITVIGLLVTAAWTATETPRVARAAEVQVSETRWPPLPINGQDPCAAADPIIGRTSVSSTDLSVGQIIRVRYDVAGPPATTRADEYVGFEFGGTPTISLTWLSSYYADIVGVGSTRPGFSASAAGGTGYGYRIGQPDQPNYGTPEFGTNNRFAPGDSVWIDYQIKVEPPAFTVPSTRVSAAWLGQQYESRSNIAMCWFDIDAEPDNELVGSIRLIHDDPTNTSGKFERHEEFTVRLRVGSSADSLDDLRTTLDVTGLLAAAPNLEIVSGAAPVTPGGPTTVAPGAVSEYEWRVRPIDYGRFTVRATATATPIDGSDEDVAPLSIEANGRIGGALAVEVTLDPEELELDENIDDGDPQPDPEPVVATVTVTNISEEEVAGVQLPEELKILDVDNPITALPRLVNVSGPWPTGETSGPVDAGPFTMAVNETRSVDYLLEGRDDGKFDIRAEVEHLAGGSYALDTGTTRFNIGVGALLAVDLENDLTGGFVDGGDIVRMSGYLENLSTTETIKVDLATLEPEITGNATPVGLRDIESTLTPTNCGWVPQVIEIAPGERTLIHGSFLAHPNGATRATVKYPTAGGVVLRGGDASTPPTEVPLTEDDVLETSSSTLDFSYQVDTSVELGEWSNAAFVYGLTIGFVEGTSEWMISGVEGIATLLQEIGSVENWAALVEHGPDLLWKATKWYVDNWVLRTPVERATYVKELARDFYDAMIAAGVAAADAENQRKAAEAVLPGWFDQVVNAYATNNAFAIGQAWGRAGGTVAPELITCIPFKPAYLGKFEKIADAQKIDRAAEVAKATKLAEAGATSSQLQAARRGIRNGSRVSEAGSLAWGVGVDAHRALSEYAQKNKLLITLRDRSPGSIARLAQGYVEKFEFMKLKNVRPDVDGPLGYLAEHADTVAFKKPLSSAELEGVLAGIPDETLRAAVKSRNEKRAGEWTKWREIYEGWEKTGFPAGFKHRPNGGALVDSNAHLPFRLRKVRVNGKVVPDYSVPEIFIDGEWRGFTGDLDIIDIRRIDGSALSPTDASKVYNDLNRLADVNLRHGDTVHWISDPKLSPQQVFKIKLDQLKDYFVGGPDKALQFAPDGVRAVQLDAGKSFVLRREIGGVAGRTTHVTWDGGIQHWVQDWTGVRLLQIDFEYSLANLPMFFAPADWAAGSCTVEMDRAEGSIVRPSATGSQLETFESGEWISRPVQECSGSVGSRSATSTLGRAQMTSGVLAILPQTAVAERTEAGASSLPVHDLPAIPEAGFRGEWFRAGDTILIDPGTDFEERRTLVDVSAFRLDRPLEFVHERNAMVTLAVPDPDPGSGSLVPLVPARVLDTRSGEVTVDGEFSELGRLSAGSVTRVQIGGRAGVDPDAAAVALNTTAVRPSGVGYVTLFPCDEDRPTTSSLNYRAGGAVGNSAIVKLNDAGELCVFTFADTDLVIDVNAWLAESDGFESLVPVRLAETRGGEVTVDGVAQELGRLSAGSVTEVQIAGRGGVDADADAVALNVTAIRPDGVGYVTLFPCGEDRPTTSSLNYSGGGAVGNSAVVSLSATGTLCAFTLAETDLVIDVNAWLADDASFDPFVPARFFETRSGEETVDGQGNGVGRRDASSVTSIQVAGRGDVPVGASAVALNVTAVQPGGVGYVTLFPCGEDRPTTSSLNYAGGGAVGNSGVVKLAADGTLCAFTFADSDLVIDVNAAWTN